MSEDAPGPGPRSRAISHGIAAILFVLATIVVFGDLWRAGPRQTVALRPAEGAYRVTPRADATFEAWLVARNARTLATRPHRELWFDRLHRGRMDGAPLLTALTSLALRAENALGGGLFVNLLLERR